MKRVLLVVVGALIVLLSIEGAVSLLGRQAWLGPVRAPMRWSGPSDAVRRQAAADHPGLYQVHSDPRIGYVLKANTTLSIYDSLVHTDGHGMRRRPGPPVPAGSDPWRIVVLGDSVAFGYGIEGDETLAHRLEQTLTDVRGPDARPVICHTVAVPSWNHLAATTFLIKELDRLDPHIVLDFPVHNDVADLSGISAAGGLADLPDINAARPTLTASMSRLVGLAEAARSFAEAEDHTLTSAGMGPISLTAKLSPESERRYAENVDSVARLHRALLARGARLALLHRGPGEYGWHLRAGLVEAGEAVPVIPLLETSLASFTLGFDPHANATTLDVYATWCAAWLLEQGWLERGADGPLPAVPEEYRVRRKPVLDDAAVIRRSRSARAFARSMLQPVIDLRGGRGVRQVYGGLNLNGTVKTEMLAVLPRQGTVLDLHLAPLEDQPGLHPLGIRVEVDGLLLQRIELDDDAPERHVRLPLPAPGPDERDTLELRLVAEDWAVVRYLGGPLLSSFRPLRLAVSSP